MLPQLSMRVKAHEPPDFGRADGTIVAIKTDGSVDVKLDAGRVVQGLVYKTAAGTHPRPLVPYWTPLP